MNVFADGIVDGDKAAETVTDDGAIIDFAVCHVEGQNYTAADRTEWSDGSCD